jgi:hypothetical protein
MSFERPIFWQSIDEPLPPGAEWVGSVRTDADGTLHFTFGVCATPEGDRSFRGC